MHIVPVESQAEQLELMLQVAQAVPFQKKPAEQAEQLVVFAQEEQLVMQAVQAPLLRKKPAPQFVQVKGWLLLQAVHPVEPIEQGEQTPEFR